MMLILGACRALSARCDPALTAGGSWHLGQRKLHCRTELLQALEALLKRARKPRQLRDRGDDGMQGGPFAIALECAKTGI